MKNKIRKILTFPVSIIIAFVLAVGLLGYSMVGGAKAALTYYSDTYKTQVETRDIGLTLVENDADIAWRDYVKEKADGTWKETKGVLLGNMLPQEQDGTIVLGERYPEVLKLKNSGTIDNYVRVTIYKYWLDENGNKVRVVSPDAINLHLINLSDQTDSEKCWLEDKSAKTDERTVLYYKYPLASSSVTPAFSDWLQIDVDMEAYAKTTKTDEGVIITECEMNGYRFVVEVTADAVQDHNAKEAILSAWGKHVEINDKAISLCE